MRIAIAADADKRSPKTRRELLQHLWAYPELRNTNVFKEGPFYAIQSGRTITATHVRRIDAGNFQWWEQQVRNALTGVNK